MSHDTDNRATEQNRVDLVIHEINKKEEKIYSKSAGLKDSVIELRKSFWEDVTVNLDEPDDVIETQASIKQQAELLSERERFHGKLGEELKTLKRLKDSPYFGRIDFIEDPGEEEDHIYIGISSLMDNDDENFLVYDWRAPISSLYYDYSPGRAAFETIEGSVTGEISLKRQFIIRQGVIKGMFDTGVTIGDHLLQQVLGNNASTTMKSIVATIQKEQNKIIRNERSDLLVVQGAAGSGKTSAALQRIAYLMYRYREELNAANVVLFSPNPLFTSYISNVLPELGEANVRQTTFLNFLERGIGDKLAIESPFHQMEYVLTEGNNAEYETRMKSIDYKSSLKFKELIDEYISYLHGQGIRFKNITFRKQILISKEKIKDYFYGLDESIAIPNKMELVSMWLLKELRHYQRDEVDKDWVMEQVELMDKEDFLKAYYKSQDIDDENDVVVEEEILRKVVVNRYFSSIKKRVKQLQFVHVLATYQKLFTEWDPQESPEDWESISTLTASDLSQWSLTWEDATPYLYFKDRLLGNHADRSVRHLLIDEAQDYSAFQYAYIKHIFPYTRLTLLGDINQAIYTYATKENPLVPAGDQLKHERITLTKSYRSTKQIVEFTKYFAPGEELIEPFNREGSKPRLLKLNKKEDLVEVLKANVENLQSIGYETIAIVCKTLKESEIIFNLLQGKVSVKKVNEETYTFEKGLLVLPVYLAKGIEFDAVIIPDASKEQYDLQSDRTLFYTACTRAMHELVMITESEPCSFIEDCPKETYEGSLV
ncbi:RNA polymerase recycling motor HelD [Virgibacillus sp. C22-A2]|uniref:RNA polymerase recycling motor HelD n=1 Tax=Virgibacillus tibetensis TaxID=3042313 RepID=A0ABU6KJJ2_9BACI|nr:RNA polymerase recycling motor HelD [Virgibacillus sp. C22-A2]